MATGNANEPLADQTVRANFIQMNFFVPLFSRDLLLPAPDVRAREESQSG